MQGAAYIPLRARDGSIRAHAIVDAADYEWLTQWRWSLHSGGYAQRSIRIDGRWRTVGMHRIILGLEPGDGLEGDHVNGKRLDNRRSNLRVVPHAGNAQNRTTAWGSSDFVGVTYRPQYGTWIAHAKVKGTRRTIGSFAREMDAAAAAAQFRAEHMPYAVEDPALLAREVGSRLRRVPDAERYPEIQRRWLAGESMREIAEAFGISVTGLGAAMTRLRQAGYELPYRRAGWV
jgi:DNA-directed RNA polymerase specialized sigma24 family protein